MGTDQDDLAAAWTLSPTFAGESATGLSVTDAWTEPQSMIFPLDIQSTNESIREGLKHCSAKEGLKRRSVSEDCKDRQLSKSSVPDLGTTGFLRECPFWVRSRHMQCTSQCPLYTQ
jgi:hypothetical protein